jgi:hypothetical protein
MTLNKKIRHSAVLVIDSAEQFGILCGSYLYIRLPEYPVNGRQQVGPGGQQRLSVAGRDAADGDDGQIKLPARTAEYRGFGLQGIRLGI